MEDCVLRLLFGSALAVTLCSPAVFATPQNSTNVDTTFTSNSELVTVPVHVTDHYGRPLQGLKKDDFILKSDGAPERIALFDEVQTQLPGVQPDPLIMRPPEATPVIISENGAVKFSNANATVPDQLYIIVLDNINMSVLMQGWARDRLIQYLRSSPSHPPIELVTLMPGGLKQLHAFTTQYSSLIDSLRSMRLSLSRQDATEPLLSHMSANGQIDSYASVLKALQERQADERIRGANAGSLTLRCFEELAWAYSGIPGRKTVVWLTSGFPIFQEVPDAPGLIGHGSTRSAYAATHHELLPEFQRAFTALNKANVVVYPIDVNGLPDDAWWDITLPDSFYVHPERAHLGPPALFDLAGSERDGMKELARRTGGKSCTAGNRFDSCLDQAFGESVHYYLLGFYVAQHQRNAGWHKLKVTVIADHGEVRARSSYFLGPLGAPPHEEQDEDLRSAINAPINYTGVLFSVEPEVGTGAAAPSVMFKVSVPATSILLLPGQDKLSFDVIAIPLSNRGTPVSKQSRVVKLDMPPASAQKAVAKGWNLIDSVTSSNSMVAIRVVVRDNYTGRIGSVVFPVATEHAKS